SLQCALRISKPTCAPSLTRIQRLRSQAQRARIRYSCAARSAQNCSGVDVGRAGRRGREPWRLERKGNGAMLQTITSSESYIILAVLAVLALVALISLLSPPMSLLDDISTRGAELRTRVRELLYRHGYSGDTKTVMVVGYVDLAFEYHKAIWLLKDGQLYGAA